MIVPSTTWSVDGIEAMTQYGLALLVSGTGKELHNADDGLIARISSKIPAYEETEFLAQNKIVGSLCYRATPQAVIERVFYWCRAATPSLMRSPEMQKSPPEAVSKACLRYVMRRMETLVDSAGSMIHAKGVFYAAPKILDAVTGARADGAQLLVTGGKYLDLTRATPEQPMIVEPAGRSFATFDDAIQQAKTIINAAEHEENPWLKAYLNSNCPSVTDVAKLHKNPDAMELLEEMYYEESAEATEFITFLAERWQHYPQPIRKQMLQAIKTSWIEDKRIDTLVQAAHNYAGPNPQRWPPWRHSIVHGNSPARLFTDSNWIERVFHREDPKEAMKTRHKTPESCFCFALMNSSTAEFPGCNEHGMKALAEQLASGKMPAEENTAALYMGYISLHGVKNVFDGMELPADILLSYICALCHERLTNLKEPESYQEHLRKTLLATPANNRRRYLAQRLNAIGRARRKKEIEYWKSLTKTELGS